MEGVKTDSSLPESLEITISPEKLLQDDTQLCSCDSHSEEQQRGKQEMTAEGLVVYAIYHPWKAMNTSGFSWPFKCLHLAIQELRNGLMKKIGNAKINVTCWCHIKRDNNSKEHSLARKGLSDDEKTLFRENGCITNSLIIWIWKGSSESIGSAALVNWVDITNLKANGVAPESALHLFRECPITLNGWSRFISNCGSCLLALPSCSEASFISSGKSTRLGAMIWCWLIWQARNNFIFNNKEPSMFRIVGAADYF
ncbi:hypothetical protein Cni_G26475 [Canna indica]|uniref:Reverse transcriptase zinc-binding domain-containing protein n=1 Tax=Canna indica TaxID=4628 RepID=A0AAQ3KZ38_9LILI|nr:hypothetical protein Cni_G26475 [Canna indica]